MQGFRKLDVWQNAYSFVLQLYRETESFPQDERFGLVSQIRRAAVSIAANIEEGCGRQSDAEFRRFLHVALGSAFELDCLLMLCADLGYAEPENRDTNQRRQLTTIRKQLNALIQRLK